MRTLLLDREEWIILLATSLGPGSPQEGKLDAQFLAGKAPLEQAGQRVPVKQFLQRRPVTLC